MRTYVSLDFKLSLAEASFAQFAANVLSRIKGNPKFPTLQSLAETELPSRQEVDVPGLGHRYQATEGDAECTGVFLHRLKIVLMVQVGGPGLSL